MEVFVQTGFITRASFQGDLRRGSKIKGTVTSVATPRSKENSAMTTSDPPRNKGKSLHLSCCISGHLSAGDVQTKHQSVSGAQGGGGGGGEGRGG